MRQAIEQAGQHSVRVQDQLVSQLYERILESVPSSNGECEFLAKFLVEQLTKLQGGSPLARRTGEKIVSLVSQSALEQRQETKLGSNLAGQSSAAARLEKPS